MLTLCMQAVRVASAQEASTSTPFQELSAGTARRYVMVSGKGGVGKTSLAASLAVQFAADGHNTLVVSTDPAHSLSDSLDQVMLCAARMQQGACSKACDSLKLRSRLRNAWLGNEEGGYPLSACKDFCSSSWTSPAGRV